MKLFAAVFRGLWIAGGLAILLGMLPAPVPKLSMLMSTSSGEAGWGVGEFQPNGVYPTTDASTLPATLPTVGSWIGGDGFRGNAATVWFRVGRRVGVMVAGYPQHTGCELWAELRDAGGNVTRVRCDLTDPRERWARWTIELPQGVAELRLVAEDAAVDGGGWLAFSRPFTQPAVPWLPLSFSLGQVLGTWALALILIFGPGLVWAPRAATPAVALAFEIGLGPAVLAAIGGAVWLLGGWAAPAGVAGVAVVILWVALGRVIWRRGFSPGRGPQAQYALAVCALVSLAAVSKATFSSGPAGELYGGTISRTLAVGDRSDSRISFHVVQVVAQHLAPASPEAERYFAPYTFFSRGPLAGLAATPVVLAVGGRPPKEMPDQLWSAFDKTGFAAYRIVLIVLASLVIFALFGVLAACVDGRWALIGAGLLAISPFGMHELAFTWPKLEATAWLLVSFLFCHQRRPFLGGCAVGIGFLFHPLAGLWLPWLALWAAGRKARPGLAVRLFQGLRFGLGASTLILPWLALGALMPHLPTTEHAGQSDFLRYGFLADYRPASSTVWLDHRLTNLANTFVPFWLWFKHADHGVLNSVYAPSGGLVKFSFLWWNTLPLGLGLGLWGLCLLALVRGLWSRPAIWCLLVSGPALALVAYWGAFATGLMRECGHPLLIAIIGVTCAYAARADSWVGRVLQHRAMPWWQLPETLLMMWLTTLANPLLSPSDFTQFDPIYFLTSVCALVAAAAVLRVARSETPQSGK